MKITATKQNNSFPAHLNVCVIHYKFDVQYYFYLYGRNIEKRHEWIGNEVNWRWLFSKTLSHIMKTFVQVYSVFAQLTATCVLKQWAVMKFIYTIRKEGGFWCSRNWAKYTHSVSLLYFTSVFKIYTKYIKYLIGEKKVASKISRGNYWSGEKKSRKNISREKN